MGRIIMFHYFHDDNEYKKVQGSIGADELEQIIVNSPYTVLSAEIWLDKYKNGTLEDHEICFSFDDGLKEQYTVALPVLEKYKIKGIFNINTGCQEKLDELEIYRYYRNYYFDTIQDFYQRFFQIVEERISKYKEIDASVDYVNYLKESTFYTVEDRKFRYWRDVILKEQYFTLMNELVQEMGDMEILKDKIWMTKEHIADIAEKGHIIGLHTHQHPTNLDDLSYEEQKVDFTRNKEILESIIQKRITVVAYPCGKYNESTLDLMTELGIDIGMIAVNATSDSNYLLLPRIDVAVLLKNM